MKSLNEYIKEKQINNSISEGFFGNLLSKLGGFLVKKFGVSGNAEKELQNNLNKETELLNSEISKTSKGKIKDLEHWWKAYIANNKNASKATPPLVYSQNILKNTSNVTIPFKKMIDDYTNAGIINNTIICMFIKTTCNQYCFIIESIIKDNSEKLNIVNQLSNIVKLLDTIKITDNEDGEKYINEIKSELEKKYKEFLSKYKK